MTHLRDLTPCSYDPYSGVSPLLAVGWLEPAFDFPRGTVKRALRDRLQALVRDPWLPFTFLGAHACRFCVQPAGIGAVRADIGRGSVPCGSANILIPGRAVVYVIPELILHYIEEHQYQPPAAFARAVEVCPPMGSRRYFLALMAAGGDMPALIERAPDRIERQAASFWRNPLCRAWYRFVRTAAIGRRLSGESVWVEVAATRRRADSCPRLR